MRRAAGRRGIRTIVAVVAVAVALVVTGCTGVGSTPLPDSTSTPLSGSVPSAAGAAGTADPALQKFYGQQLVWKDCKDGFQCTTAIAPLDWADPSGATIDLALIRKPASGKRLGSLFVNPGGPGASAVDFVRGAVGDMDKTLQQHYDVIGEDPRGIGASTPVRCDSDAQLTHYLYDLTPGARGSAQWLAAQRSAVAAFGQNCLKNTGPLLGHVDTVSNARDLDMLRAAVGDAKLNYFGFSYGTSIGSTYAGLFPKNVGRMVLDGVVDPDSSWDETSIAQAKGFESNLDDYVKWCLSTDKKHCPFHTTENGALQQIAALMQALDAHPIKNSDGRLLDGATMSYAIIEPLYDSSQWGDLDALFSDVQHGRARVAFELADAYNDRDPDTGKFLSNMMEAFQAVSCLDYPMDASAASMAANRAQLEAAAPIFGDYFAYGDLYCAGWPFPPTGDPAPVKAAGSGPILVVGTTGDPATPYADAEHLADDELQNGHLVTWHGVGHTAYGRSNSCVTHAVDGYLVNGTVPSTDPQC